MSNLDYPISILLIKLSKLTQRHPASAKDMKEKVDELNGINRAVNILRDEKRKDEKEMRKSFKRKY